MQKKCLDYRSRPTTFQIRDGPRFNLTPHRRPGARLGEAVGASKMDTDIAIYRHRFDVIAGSSLGGGSLECEILEIGKLRFEMLHRLRRIATVATASRQS